MIKWAVTLLLSILFTARCHAMCSEPEPPIYKDKYNIEFYCIVFSRYVRCLAEENYDLSAQLSEEKDKLDKYRMILESVCREVPDHSGCRSYLWPK